MQKWLKEIARDVIALASLPFYLIAIVRVAIAEHKIYTWQLVIALIVVYFLYFILRKTNLYAAMAIPLFIFTNLFYDNARYLVFSGILFLLLLVSLWYLGNKKKEIFIGIAVGVVSSGAGYYLAQYLPS